MKIGLNSVVLKRKKIRNGVYAYVTQGGINIEGISYLGYSLTDAIKVFRKNYPAY